MSMPLIVAFIGKGGVGKTVLSALAGKLFIEKGKKVLFVDADPAMGLAAALAMENFKTIGKAREEIIGQARKTSSSEETASLSEIIDYVLLETLIERPGYSMIVMGQTNTLGCYCPVNSILRSTIGTLSSNFDVIVIDAEAGIEQVNRQVVERVQYPIIVSDNTLRGVKTALALSDRIKEIPGMNPVQIGVVFNRVESPDPDLVDRVLSAGLLDYKSIAPDPEIGELDRKGASLFELPISSTAPSKLGEILGAQGILH